MKVKFVHTNNANVHSKREIVFDLKKDLGITPEEWANATEDNRMEIVSEWALQDFEYWYEELE